MRCRGVRGLRAGGRRAVEWLCRAMLSGAWPVVHQTIACAAALGGLRRGREGRPLSWVPSADAVAGNGGPLNWPPSAHTVAGAWAAGGDPQTTAWGIGRRESAPVHLHHASCNCTRLSGTRPTVGSSMTGSWHWDPGRAHGDRCVQHAGTAGDRPGVCRPHALVLDGSPARRQPLCRWTSRQTPRNEPCGVRRHPVRWGGRGAQAALLILEGKGEGRPTAARPSRQYINRCHPVVLAVVTRVRLSVPHLGIIAKAQRHGRRRHTRGGTSGCP
jgi:hypothetical protein